MEKSEIPKDSGVEIYHWDTFIEYGSDVEESTIEGNLRHHK